MMGAYEAPADMLGRAVAKLHGADSDGSIMDGDGYLIALLSKRFGAAFQEWLEAEADDQEERTSGCGSCDGRGLVNDGDPIPFDCPDCTRSDVLRVARELLRGDLS